jgi:hypothetical protein
LLDTDISQKVTGFKPIDEFLWDIQDLFAGGIVFDSWSGDIMDPQLKNNSTITINPANYMTKLTANFIEKPAIIPEGYLTTVLGVAIPVVGAWIYKNRDWFYKKRRLEYLRRYMKTIDAAYETTDQNKEEGLQHLGAIRMQIIELFGNGTIKESDYEILNRKISEYINKVKSKTISSTSTTAAQISKSNIPKDSQIAEGEETHASDEKAVHASRTDRDD